MISRSLAFLALFCLLFVVHPARAQVDEAVQAEDVAIAFFKTGDTTPDFDKWARNSKEYKVAAPAMAREIFFNEKQRLIGKWRAFDPADGVINVSGRVRVEVTVEVNKEGYEQHWMYLTFENHDVAYFPYKYLDYDIAVIPQQIETLLIQPLTKDQYELIRADMRGMPKGWAYLQLQLRPVKSYIHQPYEIDGKQQWALLCDVATMSLVSQRSRSSMWNYGADWYVSPVTDQLRDLYQNPGEGGAPAEAAPQ